MAGGATLAGAAAVLAACGGGDEDEDPAVERTGLGRLIYDSTKAETPVQRGGTLNNRTGGDLASLDPYRQIAGSVQTFAGHFFSRLVQYKSEPGLQPGLVEKKPDAAEDWEIADDGLTYTFHLRRGLKFHEGISNWNTVPGLNGREFDAEDVVASYERFKDLPAPQYQQSFGGKVLNVTAPDKYTSVWKLTRPNALFLEFITSGQFLWLMGKEAGVDYDTNEKVVGTGPWMLDEYVPSSRWRVKKNPEYYQEGGVPYLDAMEWFIVSENSQWLAQFQIGTFPLFDTILAGDMKSLAEGHDDRRIYAGDAPNSSAGIGFGRGDPDSVFLKDDRMRHAVSLAIDRELLIETVNDVDAWRALGLDRQIWLTNYCTPGQVKWYVDPRGPEMGEEAQWFMYDPQKAKELISAAGFPDGYDTEMHFAANNYPQIYRDHTLLIIGMLQEVGIRAGAKGDDYRSFHNIKNSAGESPGMVAHQNTSFGDPALLLDYLFAPNASRNQMKVNDPIFNELNAKQITELDDEKRKATLIEIYRHLAREMRFVIHSYATLQDMDIAWRWYKNYWAYKNSLAGQGNMTESAIYRWISQG